MNYRSGVDYILVLKDARGNDIGWPDYDWSARVYTRRRMCAVEVSCRGGVPVNCWNDNGRVHVALKDHRLEPGVMTIEFTAELPDGHFPDGSKPVAVPVEVGLELVRGAAPCPKQMEIDLVLPYIKGDPLTWEDLTPEQMAELQRPAREAADAFAPFAQKARDAETTRVSNEETRRTQETARADAEAERAKAERLRMTAEDERVEAEKGRATAEEARVSAEEKRAMEFAGFEKTIEEKQDKFATSEDLSLENDVLSLTERAKQRLFDDMFAQAVRPYGKVDHTHVEDDGVERHYYLNELWLTYEEAIKSYTAYTYNKDQTECGRFTGRTNIPVRLQWNGTFERWAQGNTELEVAVIDHFQISSFAQAFYGCTNMHTCRISGNNIKGGTNLSGTFYNCRALRNLNFKGWDKDLYLQYSPLLTLESMRNIVNGKASSMATATVTVHPDVYAKLADPENTEWHKVLTDALEKNISFATV